MLGKKKHPQEKSLSFTLSALCKKERRLEPVSLFCTWSSQSLHYIFTPLLSDSSRIKPKHSLVWQLKHSFWELAAPLKSRGIWTWISICWVGTQNHFNIFKEMQHYILFLPKEKCARLGLSSWNWGIPFRSVHYWWYLCLLSNLTAATFERYSIFFFPHSYVLVCNWTPQHYKTSLYQQTYTDHLPLKIRTNPKSLL